MKMEASSSIVDVQPERQYPTPRAGQLGRGALALAGVTLALLATRATEAPASAAASISPAGITQELDFSALPPTTTAPPTGQAAYSGPEVGVATGTWNDDGLGKHTLCKNIAAEGMQEVRLNFVVGSRRHPLREMLDEIASCLDNDVAPIIAFPLGMKPNQIAQTVTELPSVNQIVYGDEVNSPLFSKLTPRQYVFDLAHTNAAIRQWRPDVKVWGFAEASGYKPLAYLEKAKRIANQYFGGLDNIMFGLDYHLYRTLDEDLAMINAYHKLFDGPERIGETGFIVDEPNHPGSVTQPEQADDETTLITDLEQDPQIEGVDIFRYKANPADPFDTANVSQTGVKRDAYYYLQSTLTDR